MIFPSWIKLVGVALACAGAVAAVVAAYVEGKSAGKAECQSAELREQALVSAAVEAANRASADAISQIKVVNTTIKQRIERETSTNVVYRECRHSDGVLRDINEALTGKRADPAASAVMPTGNAAGR